MIVTLLIILWMFIHGWFLCEHHTNIGKKMILTLSSKECYGMYGPYLNIVWMFIKRASIIEHPYCVYITTSTHEFYLNFLWMLLKGRSIIKHPMHLIKESFHCRIPIGYLLLYNHVLLTVKPPVNVCNLIYWKL